MDKFYEVTVIGAPFIDLIAYSDRLPERGETLAGTDFQKGFGGKGANQCVAAARLGSKTAFLSKVGNDSHGSSYLEHLKTEGVNIEHIKIENDKPTGVASILVSTNDGENMIVIVPGASGAMNAAYVEDTKEVIEKSKILLAQLEIPVEATILALQVAKKSNTMSILNVAPASKQITKELLEIPDILCLNENETELAVRCKKIEGIEDAKDAIRNMTSSFNVKNVIVTLGQEGAVVWDAENKTFFETKAPKVDTIDSTGAGDCFVGTMAHCLANGLSLKLAVEQAVLNASQSVTKKGTQSSFPHALLHN